VIVGRFIVYCVLETGSKQQEQFDASTARFLKKIANGKDTIVIRFGSFHDPQ
jgi:hypothetical protein